MTVGEKKFVVKFKDISGKEYSVESTKEQSIFELKKMVTKKMNATDKDTPNVHPAQLKLSHNNIDLEDDKCVGEVDDIKDGYVFVVVGDASKVPIKIKVNLFKGAGVEVTTLDVTLGNTADQVKDKLIAANFGPQEKSYTLFFKGRPLLSQKPLSDFGVEDGSEILLGVIM